MTPIKTIKKDLISLVLIFGVFFGFNLGVRPLSTPDEGRYAEIPREMVASDDYVTPRLNGVKYFEKPPLMYWLGSLSLKVFGPKEWGLRLWPALFSLLSVLLVYLTGTWIYNRSVGWLSSLTLGTSLLFYSHSQILILDGAVSFFITLSLFSFILASLFPKKQTLALGMFYTAMAMATLSKGLIGAVIPGTIILIWTSVTKQWKTLGLAFKPWGIFLYLAIMLPWHILVSLKNPEFPYFYFIQEHLLRYTTTMHGRKQFFGFFILIAMLGWFPWIGFFGPVFKQYFKNAKLLLSSLKTDFFWLISAAFILAFYSASKSQLIPYVLPVFPPLSLVLGKSLSTIKVLQFKAGFYVFLGISFILAALIPLVIVQRQIDYLPILPHIIIAIAILFLSPPLVFLLFLKKGPLKALYGIMMASFLLCVTVTQVWPTFENRSIKTLSDHLKSFLTSNDQVICYRRYYQDLPFYLNRIVNVVGWKGELEFGMDQEDTSAWMMQESDFRKLWQSHKKVYMVTRKESYDSLKSEGILELFPLAETKEDILVVNKEPL